jgi:hypothetical protein
MDVILSLIPAVASVGSGDQAILQTGDGGAASASNHLILLVPDVKTVYNPPPGSQTLRGSFVRSKQSSGRQILKHILRV